MASRLFTWSAAVNLTPVPAADATSDVIDLGGAGSEGKLAVPGQGLAYVAIVLTMSDGQGGNPAGAYTLSVSVQLRYAAGSDSLMPNSVLLDDTGAVRTWAILHASGATETRLLQFSVPAIPGGTPGPDRIALIARAAGAGQAGSRLVARVALVGSAVANT